MPSKKKFRPSFHGRNKPNMLSTATRLFLAAGVAASLQHGGVDPQTNAVVTITVLAADPVARLRRYMAVQRMKASLEGYPENPPVLDRFGRPVED